MIEKKPEISVIIPCYNQAQYLDECLQSVLSQTFQDWECIIINDGSPDNTEEVALAWTEKDNRFKYIKKENGGVSETRNLGLEIAQGKYIQFLDSDDKIHMQKFEKELFILNQGFDICVSNYIRFGVSKKTKNKPDKWSNKIENFRQDIIFRWHDSFCVPIQTVLIRLSIIADIKFENKFTANEDWLFWVDIAIKNPKVYYIDEVLSYYRIHNMSVTQNLALMKKYEIRARFKIMSKLEGEENSAFVEKTEQFILTLVNGYNVQVDSIRKSKAYRLGKFILKPFNILIKFINR